MSAREKYKQAWRVARMQAKYDGCSKTECEMEAVADKHLDNRNGNWYKDRYTNGVRFMKNGNGDIRQFGGQRVWHFRKNANLDWLDEIPF